VAQVVRPERWVIVDDVSTDRTPEIVAEYAKGNPWIVLVRRSPRADRSFASKAHAVNAGLEQLQDLEFEVMGIMDGDVSFGPDYLGFIVEKFALDPKLGVAGTPFTEEGYDTARDSFEGENHVAGACQMFRYRCFREIGGYVANRAGGVDWIAVTTARMKGWTTRSFPEKRLHHHRPMGTAERGAVSALFSYGEKDYYLGGSPIWQIFRVAYRTLKKPYIVGGLALFSGYTWAALRRTKRPVSPELMRFHRQEQMKKLRGIFRSLLRLQKVDNFSLKPKQST
jgi:biofilm PGA synthesis N-glycosyltransferase PgaC